MHEGQRWPYVLASAPLWPIVWILLFASLARVKLGFWPSYDHPDPTALHWPILDIPVLALLLLAPLALLASLILAIRAWYTGRRGWRFLLTLISLLALIAWLRFDPGGFFNWWID